MEQESINICLDSEVKTQAQALFAKLGLDLSTAVNIFLRQSIREQKIPFEIRAQPHSYAGIDLPYEQFKRYRFSNLSLR